MNDRIAQEWNLLAADAVKLENDKFLKIYRLLEQVGEAGSVQAAFASLRPRLTELKPPRRPSASRMFFRPIEDLLDDTESYARRLNRISRSTLPPCWRALKDKVDRRTLEDFQIAVAAVDPRDAREILKIGTPLWRAGAQAVRAILTEAGQNLKYKIDTFGRDDDVLRQLEVLADVMDIGPEVETLKLALPERPIGDLAESHIESIRIALQSLGREVAAKARPMLLVLAARMKRPGDLLKLLAHVSLGQNMGEKEALTKELSGMVVGNLLRQSTAIERVGDREPTASEIASQAERLTEGLNSVNDTVQALRDRDMSKRVDAARSEIGNFVMRSIVEDVDKTLIDTLFHGDTLAASNASIKQAEQLAMALRRSTKLAPHLGINREVQAKVAEVRRSVEGEVNEMLRANRPGPQGLDPSVERQMFNGLRMIEILAGSEEADRLYRDWKRQVS